MKFANEVSNSARLQACYYVRMICNSRIGVVTAAMVTSCLVQLPIIARHKVLVFSTSDETYEDITISLINEEVKIVFDLVTLKLQILYLL